MITNEDIPEAGDIFDSEEFDNYVNVELAMERHDYGPEFARFNKRLKEKYSRSFRIAADNQILYTRMSKVEYDDEYKTEMTSNAVSILVNLVK